MTEPGRGEGTDVAPLAVLIRRVERPHEVRLCVHPGSEGARSEALRGCCSFRTSAHRSSALEPWLLHYNFSPTTRRPQPQAARLSPDEPTWDYT